MVEISVEDLVFATCTLVGGGLLLITVLLDDILSALFDGFDLGGMSLMPLLLSFISMFGVGGLFATQILELHGGQAALVGGLFGLAGLGIAYTLFSLLKRSEAPPSFSTGDLVGHEASVAVSIPAGRQGSVYVKAEGQTHEFNATATADIRPGPPCASAASPVPGCSSSPLALRLCPTHRRQAPGGGRLIRA